MTEKDNTNPPGDSGEQHPLLSLVDSADQTPEEIKSQSNWIGLLTIEMPAGVTMHPAILDEVDRRLAGRGPVVSRNLDRLSLAYAARGIDDEAALRDAAAIRDGLLGMLGLGYEAIVEHIVEPRRPITDYLSLPTLIDLGYVIGENVQTIDPID